MVTGVLLSIGLTSLWSWLFLVRLARIDRSQQQTVIAIHDLSDRLHRRQQQDRRMLDVIVDQDRRRAGLQ